MCRSHYAYFSSAVQVRRRSMRGMISQSAKTASFQGKKRPTEGHCQLPGTNALHVADRTL